MGKNITQRITIIFPIIFTLIGCYILYQVFSPEIEYRIDKPNEIEIINSIEDTENYSENRLIIPSIGVDMEIGVEKGYLDFGGWIQRTNNDFPDLIAVHRFGWSTLLAEQKMKQTLYHVDKLEKGDIVYIIWDGEKYKFEIQEIMEGTNNPSIEGIIIYTCKFLRSNQRVFVILMETM